MSIFVRPFSVPCWIPIHPETSTVSPKRHIFTDCLKDATNDLSNQILRYFRAGNRFSTRERFAIDSPLFIQ